VFESGGTRKTGLTGSLSRAPFARSLPHPLPRKKKLNLNLGLAEMQFPAVLSGILAHSVTSQSIFDTIRYDTIR